MQLKAPMESSSDLKPHEDQIGQSAPAAQRKDKEMGSNGDHGKIDRAAQERIRQKVMEEARKEAERIRREQERKKDGK